MPSPNILNLVMETTLKQGYNQILNPTNKVILETINLIHTELTMEILSKARYYETPTDTTSTPNPNPNTTGEITDINSVNLLDKVIQSYTNTGLTYQVIYLNTHDNLFSVFEIEDDQLSYNNAYLKSSNWYRMGCLELHEGTFKVIIYLAID